MSDSLLPHGLYIFHGILQARILELVAFPSPGDLFYPGIKPRSPALQADSLPAEPQGKPIEWVQSFCLEDDKVLEMDNSDGWKTM